METKKEYTPTFEERISQEIQRSVLDEIRKNCFLKLQYQQRQVLPEGIMENLWNSVDWSEVIQQLKPEMEKRICNSILGAMETEIKTDVKKVMSIDGVRQKLRVEIYPRLMKILDEV